MHAELKGAAIALAWVLIPLSLGAQKRALGGLNWSGVWRGEADLETVWCNDILLVESALGFRQRLGRRGLNLSVSYGYFQLDYAPADFDPFGIERQRSEDRTGFQLGLLQSLSKRWEVTASGGVYHGYTDHRSLWLDEYYRQQFGNLEDYEESDPWGYNLSAGLRWEYIPSSGFIQLQALFSRDDVAPGYEIDFDGLFRGTETLYTWTGRISFENVLTSRIRSLNEFIITDTTDREIRSAYQGSLNWALTRRWVARAVLGGALEKPEFDAYYFSFGLDFDCTSSLLFSFSGRYYSDTGEIEDALLFSSAAPALESYQLGLGLRWVKNLYSFKLFVARYFTRYEDPGIGVASFVNLYRDRNWTIVQCAFSKEW